MGEFSVKSAYEEIRKKREKEGGPEVRSWGFRGVWKNVAPFKVQTFGWRLLWNRLPTGDNLIRRLGIQRSEGICMSCGVEMESANHFFLQSTNSEIIWNKMVEWLGTRWAAPQKIVDHFEAFTYLLGEGKWRRWVGGLWLCVTWVLWNWRNQVRFEMRSWDYKRIDEEIRCRFWSWIACSKLSDNGVSYSIWMDNSLRESLMNL